MDYSHLKQFVSKCESTGKKDEEVTLALRILNVWVEQNDAENQKRADYLEDKYYRLDCEMQKKSQEDWEMQKTEQRKRDRILSRLKT